MRSRKCSSDQPQDDKTNSTKVQLLAPSNHTYSNSQSKIKQKFFFSNTLNNSDEIGFTNSVNMSMPFLSTNSGSNSGSGSNTNSQSNSRSDLLSHKDSSETMPSRKGSSAFEDILTDIDIVDTRKQSDNYLGS